MRKYQWAWLGVCSLAASISVAAPVAPAQKQKIVDAMKAVDPTLVIADVSSTPVQGLYRASVGGAQGYVTGDGQYFIVGDMFEVKSRRNLADEQREGARREAMASIRNEDAIVFAAAKPKHLITVFTDVECGYCRKLHSEIAQYNQAGISVRYVAFPRTGPGTQAWKTMEAVWCSKDRRDALTRAKLGEAISGPAGCAAPAIATQYALGEKLGLQGTPLIVFDDGRSVGGYMNATQLAQMLDRPANAVAKNVAQQP